MAVNCESSLRDAVATVRDCHGDSGYDNNSNTELLAVVLAILFGLAKGTQMAVESIPVSLAGPDFNEGPGRAACT